MSEQQWLGNPGWDAIIEAELGPLEMPWWKLPITRDFWCECPPEARHSDDCSWTPIFAQLARETPLPTPIEWPFGYAIQRIEWAYGSFNPRWLINEGNWILPDYQFPNDPKPVEPLPPWAIRQENPDK